MTETLHPPRCRVCGQEIPRRREWSFAYWQARQRCSIQACPGRHLIRPDFPGAVSAASLPGRCGRCGGPWRAVEDGVVCVLCGAHRAVTEALLRLAQRGSGEEADP